MHQSDLLYTEIWILMVNAGFDNIDVTKRVL
jgi:hypothetical protein